MTDVSVFGIGYVGVVSATCLADQGHHVIAVDLDPSRIESINSGRCPFEERGVAQLVSANVNAGRLTATTDASKAVKSTDVLLVCVGTPGKADGSIDLSQVIDACTAIGSELTKDRYRSVVIRSTLVPGTMESICIPLLESASGLVAGADFGVGYYPEFLREGSALEDYRDPGLVVFGTLDKITRQRLREFNGTLPCQVVPIAAAELIKYASNAWRALKITFANEIGNIAKACAVDGQQAMHAICQDTKVNISPAFLKPGFAFGGSCLPKDVRAIKHLAEERGLAVPLLAAILEANAKQIERAEDLVEQCAGRCVGMVGVAFKAGTDDMRESPLALLAGRLIAKGFELKIYDPYVTASYRSNGHGGARASEPVPDLKSRLVPQINELVAVSDVILVGNYYEEIREPLRRASLSKNIVDLTRIDPDRRTGGLYQGICW